MTERKRKSFFGIPGNWQKSEVPRQTPETILSTFVQNDITKNFNQVIEDSSFNEDQKSKLQGLRDYVLHMVKILTE